MDSSNRFSNMHSILEVPVLNEKYLHKARQSDADAVMLDLEDSAPPERKAEARAKMAAILAAPGAFGHRAVFVRVNNLASDWGRADLDALAACEAEATVCYPKVESRAEMERLVSLVRAVRPQAGVYAMIETARAVSELDEIASCEGLVGLHFGYVDYATEMGCQLFATSGDDLHPAMNYARARVATAARTNSLFSTGGSMIPELKHMEKVERFARSWKAYGYTACMALSPSHVETINRVFRPSEELLHEARAICAAFEGATTAGALNVVLDGKIVTGPDYRNARLLLDQAERRGDVHP